ncbi:MAG: D-alanyl-D-alanine carboxypeptidase family protein [Deltaproteobacteria bacterium]
MRVISVLRGLLAATLFYVLAFQQAAAAPYADIVIDARTGQVLHETNADARLHPASLTKMMTLYITFEAIKRGEIGLDSEVTVSAHAASEPPSKLGLREGQKIKLRYLIRAAAIKSANDAATAIGEAIGGSEAGFARRMNRTAAALGMKRSQFKNANGLTEEGHYSTARDMSTLGRHLFYDHPEFYNLFSRLTADTGGKVVANTNSRFLNGYKGADGIKTGFTNAAGFNLVSSAERDGVRIIGTIFGGLSTAQRTAKMVELMDIGFAKAPKSARTRKPEKPAYADVEDGALIADAGETGDDDIANGIAESVAARGVAAGKTIRVMAALATSPFPKMRPSRVVVIDGGNAPSPVPDEVTVAMMAAKESMQASIESALAEASTGDLTADDAIAPPMVELAGYTPLMRPLREVEPAIVVAEAEAAKAEVLEEVAKVEVAAVEAPVLKPVVEAEVAPVEVAAAAPVVSAEEAMVAEVQLAAVEPVIALQPTPVIEPETFDVASAEPVVVSRLSTSGGRHWAINVGVYNSSYDAEKILLRTALQEIGTLDDALRKVVKSKKGYEANFVGLTEDTANLACRRLSAREVPCTPIGPES